MYQKSTKRRQQAMRTKENIFHMATSLFREKGFENTTIEEITSSAGISTGTFYYYFKSKEELIFEWVNQLDEAYQKFYEGEVIFVKPDTVLQLLKKKIILVFENYSCWGRDVVAISYSYMMRNEELRERMTDSNRICNQIAYELFKKGQMWGIVRTDITVDDLIKSNIKLERGALIDWCILGGKSSIVKDNESFIEIYIDGIRSNYNQRVIKEGKGENFDD